MENRSASLEALADKLTGELVGSVDSGITYDMKPELMAVHEAINALRDLATAYKAVDALSIGVDPQKVLFVFGDSDVDRWSQ